MPSAVQRISATKLSHYDHGQYKEISLASDQKYNYSYLFSNYSLALPLMPRSFKHKAIKIQKSETLDIIRKLHGMRGVQGAELESRQERWSSRLFDKLMKTAALLLITILMFTLWHTVSPLNQYAVLIVIFLSIAAIVIPGCAILIMIFSTLASITNLKKNSLDHLIVGIENDQKHVRELTAFTRKDLENAERIIQLKITRIKSSISLIVGAPDKVALFSVAAIGWTLLKEFSSKNFPIKFAEISWLSAPLYEFLLSIVFLLAMLAFAVVALSRRMQDYVYQSEILDLTITLKKEMEIP